MCFGYGNLFFGRWKMLVGRSGCPVWVSAYKSVVPWLWKSQGGYLAEKTEYWLQQALLGYQIPKSKALCTSSIITGKTFPPKWWTSFYQLVVLPAPSFRVCFHPAPEPSKAPKLEGPNIGYIPNMFDPSTQLKKYACQIGSFPHGIGVKLDRLGLARCRRRRTIWQSESKHHPSQHGKTQTSCGILDFLLVKQLMHKIGLQKQLGWS